MKKKKLLKIETGFDILVILIWTQTILVSYVKAVLLRLPIVGDAPDFVLALFYIIAFIWASPYFRLRLKDLVFVAAVIVVFLLEFAFYEERDAYFSQYLPTVFFTILPLYVVGVSLWQYKNKDKLIHLLYIFSIFTLIANIVYHFVFGEALDASTSQYVGEMNLAYYLLPHCCLIAYNAVKKTNLINIVMTVVGVLYLLMLGTRGVALIYLSSILVLIILGRRRKGTVLRAIVLFGGVGGFIASPLFDRTIQWLTNQATRLGLSIRFFDKLLLGEVTQSNSREIIANTLFQAIGKRPFFGYGLFSDRVLAGHYAHNIAIELWVEFGVLIGTVILAAIVLVLLFGYIRAKDTEGKGLIFCLICACFLKLFLSGSYLDERLLFFLLGLCVSSMREGRERAIYAEKSEKSASEEANARCGIQHLIQKQ